MCIYRVTLFYLFCIISSFAHVSPLGMPSSAAHCEVVQGDYAETIEGFDEVYVISCGDMVSGTTGFSTQRVLIMSSVSSLPTLACAFFDTSLSSLIGKDYCFGCSPRPSQTKHMTAFISLTQSWPNVPLCETLTIVFFCDCGDALMYSWAFDCVIGGCYLIQNFKTGDMSSRVLFVYYPLGDSCILTSSTLSFYCFTLFKTLSPDTVVKYSTSLYITVIFTVDDKYLHIASNLPLFHAIEGPSCNYRPGRCIKATRLTVLQFAQHEDFGCVGSHSPGAARSTGIFFFFS
jgi:hypothetical protein